jgi:tetraacyldisaccharide-1-P 4'-kinase
MLRRQIEATGARSFVTTAKDHVRLEAIPGELGASVHVARLRVFFEDEREATSWLKSVIG